MLHLLSEEMSRKEKQPMFRVVLLPVFTSVFILLLAGCRSGWPEAELIRVDTGNYRVALLNPAEIDRTTYNCRFSGGGWFSEIVPGGVGENIVHPSTVIEGIPSWGVHNYQAFGLPEEFEEAFEIGRNPDGTRNMIRIGVGEVLRRPEGIYLDRLVKAYPWKVVRSGEGVKTTLTMTQTVPGYYILEKKISFATSPDRILVAGKLTNLSSVPIVTPVYLHPFFRTGGIRAELVRWFYGTQFDADRREPSLLNREVHWFRPDPERPVFSCEDARPLALASGSYVTPGIGVGPFRNDWITCGSLQPLISFKCDRQLDRMLHWHQNNSEGHTFAVEPGFELRVAPGEAGDWSWQFALPPAEEAAP